MKKKKRGLCPLFFCVRGGWELQPARILKSDKTK